MSESGYKQTPRPCRRYVCFAPDSRHSSVDVHFRADCVRFTSRCGPPGRCPRSSGFDPKPTLALPQNVEHWSLTTLREKLVKIGAKVVRHGRYITFQMTEVAIPRTLFAEILRLIDRLRPAPLPP